MPGNGFAAHREVALAPQVMAFLLSRVGQPLFGWSIREISIVRVISRVWLGKLVACRSFCCLTPVKWLVTGQSLSNSDSSEEEKRVGLLRLKLDINWLCKRKRKNRSHFMALEVSGSKKFWSIPNNPSHRTSRSNSVWFVLIRMWLNSNFDSV